MCVHTGTMVHQRLTDQRPPLAREGLLPASRHIDFHLGHSVLQRRRTLLLSRPISSPVLLHLPPPPFLSASARDPASTLHSAALKPLHLGSTLSQILLDVEGWYCFRSQRWKSSSRGPWLWPGRTPELNRVSYLAHQSKDLIFHFIQRVLIGGQCGVSKWRRRGDKAEVCKRHLVFVFISKPKGKTTHLQILLLLFFIFLSLFCSPTPHLSIQSPPPAPHLQAEEVT